MTRDLNSPRVIAERTCYVVHVLVFIGGVVSGITALASMELFVALQSSGLLTLACLLRQVGKRWLRFLDHERTWTHDRVFSEGDLDDPLDELLALFERLENEPMGPIERQKLRRRIVELLRQDERLMRYYSDRIDSRHPYLRNAF